MKNVQVSALLILLFMYLVLNCVAQQTCKCSENKINMSKEFIEKYSKNKGRIGRSKREAGTGTRILGGYSTLEPRPWIASIIRRSDSGVSLCGGSVINKRYILTAAHCVCFPYGECKKGVPTYDPRDIFKVYLGLNSKKVTFGLTEMRGTPNEYGVEKIIAHDKYIYWKMKHDIALMKLDRDIKFKNDHIMPICLPKADDKSDMPQKKGQVLALFVAGWGKKIQKCMTDENGPVNSLKCVFPFEYNGQTYDTCSFDRSPSTKIRNCKKIKRKKLRRKYPKSPGDHVMIDNGKQNISCHAYTSGENGWCKGIKDGDIVKDNNWGWCRPGCHLDGIEKYSSDLQETQLEILRPKHCRELVQSVRDDHYKFYGRYEFCAGKKKKFPQTYLFKKDKKRPFKFMGHVTNFLGLNEDGKYEYDYYISGTDSCSGDSGGPAYMWVDGKPILYGIISRGMGSNGEDGCAELNFPGIYTRTTKYLDWIHENSADGNC